jgi:hypothetical protein
VLETLQTAFSTARVMQPTCTYNDNARVLGQLAVEPGLEGLELGEVLARNSERLGVDVRRVDVCVCRQQHVVNLGGGGILVALVSK